MLKKSGVHLFRSPGALAAIMIFLIGFVLAAGCISSSSQKVLPDANMSAASTPQPLSLSISPVITPVQAQCRQENVSPFISINPIPDHYLGDTITFGGTTNLAPGEQLLTQIYTDYFSPCAKCQILKNDSVMHCCGSFSRIIIVKPGDCSMNTWSLDVNTSEHDFSEEGYIIQVQGRNGLVINESHFTVSGMPKPNLTLNLPENDPTEYALRFSGQVNTGNGPSENLFLNVSSDTGKKASYKIPVYRDGTGYFWNFTMRKSVIVPYNFLSVDVSSVTSPEIRIVRTFLYNNEPSYYPYNPYSG